MDVCLKLREAAIANDEALMRQVDELERQGERALPAAHRPWAYRRQRPRSRRHPPAPGLRRHPTSPDKPLDPRTAASQLAAPSLPVPVGGTASLPPAPNGTPVLTYREVQP